MKPTLHITGLCGKVDVYMTDKMMKNEINKLIELSPNHHQICIRLYHSHTPNKMRYNQNRMFQGFYYLRNPNYKLMTRVEFGKILCDIGNDFGHCQLDKTGPGIALTGETYIGLLVKITNIMDKIVSKLDKRCPVEGWSWQENSSIGCGVGKCGDNLELLDAQYNK
jgi:hypothetical protein